MIKNKWLEGELTLEIPLFKLIIEEIHKKISADVEFFEKNVTQIEKLNTMRTISDPELKMIKILINFNAYTLQNRLTEPNFHTPEEIITRFRTMRNVLEAMSTCLNLEQYDTNPSFSNEKECFIAFKEIFTEELFVQPYFRRVCSEVYRAVVGGKIQKPTEILLKHIYESIKLFLFGISLPTDNVADYPLHKAIYKSDIAQITKLCEGTQTNCFYCNVEQADPIGLSALTLAIRLGKPEIVKILVENGADPRHKVIPKCKFPMEEAMSLKNKEIIKMLLIASYQLRLNRWDKTKDSVLTLLESIPDFSFDLHWECDSNFIPFVSKLAPSDTNKITKRGSSLRMDATIAGIKKLKVTRGNISLFLLGRDHPGYEGKILMVNHGKKTIINLMDDINLKQLEKQVDYVAKQNNLPNEIKPEDVQFEPAKSWRGEPVTEKIQGYNTVKYHAKGTIHMLYTQKVYEEAAKFDSYEKYFEACFQNRFWAPTSLDDISPFEQILSYISSDPNLSKKFLETEGKEEKKGLDLVSKFARMKNSQNKVAKETKKHIDASIWLTDNFPLHFEHLIAVLDILSSASPNISKLKDFLEKRSILNNRSFPLKAVIPLYLSVSAVINFKNFVFKAPDASLFEPAKDKNLTPATDIMKLYPTSGKKIKIGDSSTLVHNLVRSHRGSEMLELAMTTSLHRNTAGRNDQRQGTGKSDAQAEENIADTSVIFESSKPQLSARMERYSIHSEKRSEAEKLLTLKNGRSEFFHAEIVSQGRHSLPCNIRPHYLQSPTSQSKPNIQRDYQTNFSVKTTDDLITEKQEEEKEVKMNRHQNGVLESPVYGVENEYIPTEYLTDSKGHFPAKFTIPTTIERKSISYSNRASIKW